MSGLNPGSGFQVRLRHVGRLSNAIVANGNNSWYQWGFGSSDAPLVSWVPGGLFTTTCSCDLYNPTGAPEDLLVTQVYGHMMFTWTDASVCEATALVTRSVAGTGSNNVTVSQQQVQLGCGTVYAPTTSGGSWQDALLAAAACLLVAKGSCPSLVPGLPSTLPT